MAFKKTQNHLTISKTKSEQIVEFIADVVHWSVLSENLDYTRYKSFDCKKNVRTMYNELEEASEDNSDNIGFDVLSEVFTIKEMNIVIDIFNDYVEHPEKYEKPKKKKDIDIDKQLQAVRRNMKDFQSGLSYEKGLEQINENSDKNSDRKPKKEQKKTNEAEVLEEHTEKVKKQREEINKLPQDSEERTKKEAEFQHNKADRIKEFWDSQKKDK